MISAVVTLAGLRRRRLTGRAWRSTAPWAPVQYRFSSFRLVEEI